MEFNQKLRGQKHHKNKVRYKPKFDNKKNVHGKDKGQQLNKCFRVLSSDEEDNENEQTTDTNEAIELNDFTLLAQAPISVGGHFQFKRDKNLETACDLKKIQENNLFSLDLNILQHSLGCIPFYERCNLDKSYFTEGDLENMNARAQVQYETYLKLISAIKKNSEVTIAPEALAKSEKLEMDQTDSKSKTNGIIKPRSLQPESIGTEITTPNKEVNKEELEDWLDDILGD